MWQLVTTVSKLPIGHFVKDLKYTGAKLIYKFQLGFLQTHKDQNLVMLE